MAAIQERFPVSSSSSSSSSASSPSSSLSLSTVPIDGELWMIAEERVQEILCVIQPIYLSDRSRNEIIAYIQNLIKDRLGIEVFLFGSVPLKTYLPDGDIDLTVLTPQDTEEDLAEALCSMLRAEGGASDFQVTGVQYIQAQVKVIKFNIKNIAVDISFNQMAGLCALCFLEQVDQKFGRDHLFKRSIILIKAWCYYESRLLGANTGLISTYALAVLVLYIINSSYSSLSGPLAVLFKFLDYYASFDWENYCITVTGPVPISSLPDITGTGDHEVVLNEKFFRECVETYSVQTKVVEANRQIFPVKHFNILDPLKHSNNLGRSVSQGNVPRLRHAFTLGVQRLRDILSVPGETMGWKLEKFFRNTLDRNGKGQRQDVAEPLIAFGTGRTELSDLRGDFEGYYRSLVYGKWFHGEYQYSWIPQGQETSSWDVVNWSVTDQKNVLYWTNPDGSTSMQNMQKSRGTGTYIPEMSQQSYTDRFSITPSTVNAAYQTQQSYTNSFSSTPSTVSSASQSQQSYTGSRFSSRPSTVNSASQSQQSYTGSRFSSRPSTVNSASQSQQSYTDGFSITPGTVNAAYQTQQFYTNSFSSTPSTVNSASQSQQSYTGSRFSSRPSTVNSASQSQQSYTDGFSSKPSTVNSAYQTQQSYTGKFSIKPSTVNSASQTLQSYNGRFSIKPSTVNSAAQNQQSYNGRISIKPSTVNSAAQTQQSYNGRFSIKPSTVNSASQTQQSYNGSFSSKPSTVNSVSQTQQSYNGNFSSKPSTVNSASQTQQSYNGSFSSKPSTVNSASQTQLFKQNP
ncbi:PREDICTED: uncharacterized protein LOC104785349 [Camelina sativa]|uniref:Uncharacterized protein LOC104785349 n=1 Tax=Camelina sativa TaxID=90675 RepID=A0ABM0Z0U4_CAMSA|nr:PREDICTED: uncharacterized protein LOC104785349 [Camelina sativa]XP_010508847.1 PREDICTED: uncharacterized protein LOC104785349 [Camelina sativa]